MRKYDSAGIVQWTRQFGSIDLDSAFDVATDASGNVVVAGSTHGALPSQTSTGDDDAFVRKYSSAGGLLWTRQFGTGGADAVNGVAVDTTGSVVVAGETSAAFPGQTFAGSIDAFARKYDSAGTTLWTLQFGTSGYDFGLGVAVDSLGNPLVAGSAEGALPGQTALGNADAFVVRTAP